MITHGFKYEKAERKDMYAKTHPCISKWEVLKVEKPDTLEYDFTPYYILKADLFLSVKKFITRSHFRWQATEQVNSIG